MSTRTALYPGSFDPITVGHTNILERGLKMFDHIILAVAVNSTKQTVFSVAERIALLRALFEGNKRITVDSFTDQLLVDYAATHQVHVILRGLRTVSDYDSEFQMAHANRNLNAKIDTIFMMTDPSCSHISSTLIKEIARYGGSCEGLLDPRVEQALRAKLNPQ